MAGNLQGAPEALPPLGCLPVRSTRRLPSPALLPSWSSALPLLCARLPRLMALWASAANPPPYMVATCPCCPVTLLSPAPASLLGPDTPQPNEPFPPNLPQPHLRCPGCQTGPRAYGTSPCWHATPANILKCPLPLAWLPRVRAAFGAASFPHSSLVPKQATPWPAPHPWEPLALLAPRHPESPVGLGAAPQAFGFSRRRSFPRAPSLHRDPDFWPTRGRVS